METIVLVRKPAGESVKLDSVFEGPIADYETLANPGAAWHFNVIDSHTHHGASYKHVAPLNGFDENYAGGHAAPS